MHDSVMTWFEQQAGKIDCHGKDILEVGSLNVNGTVRPLFKDAGTYTGIDITAGPGVDRVMDAHNLLFESGAFDLVICSEMLEHDSNPWKTMMEINRVLRIGGKLFVTARGNQFPYHEYPKDYWRFFQDGLRSLLEIAGCQVEEIMDDPGPFGVFAVGVKLGKTTRLVIVP